MTIQERPREVCTRFSWLLCLGVFCFAVGQVRADQIEMVNGDRYVGRVVSMGSNTLVLQSEVLGTLKLPRAGIAVISLRPGPSLSQTNPLASKTAPAPSNATPHVAAKSAASNGDLNSLVRQLGTSTNALQQVREQLLTGAGPEAQTKFNDLVSGLLSGKMGISDLRAEAKSTLAQAQSMRKELGEEGGSMLDSYLAILSDFIKETDDAPAAAIKSPSATNSVPVVRKPSLPKPVEDE